MKHLIDMLNMPATEWTHLVKTNDASSFWADIETQLDAVACKAAMLAGYISARAGTSGCGAQDHPTAVKYCNRRLVRVRRAMGYTYPNRGQICF